MKLTYLGKHTNGGQSPTAFATDRDTLVIQGWRVTDEDALTEMHRRGLPDHETAVEIPLELLKYLPEGGQ